MRRLARACAAVVLAAAAAPSCIPYSVGSTAATAPVGQLTPSSSVFFIPGGVEREYGDSTESLPIYSIDAEGRFGLDERSDIGVRVPGLIGVIINYKRRFGGEGGRAATAIMLGGGIVNAGAHGYGELTWIASGRERETLTPYGGVRVMHVLPISPSAVRDDPTVGVFFGVRLGRRDLGISPEIGVFYDRSALGLRRRDVIIVPSFTFHGSEFIRILRGFR